MNVDEVINRIATPLKQVVGKSREQFDDWFVKDTHRFTITGLSRSGKSMLFTSLMTILKYRTEEQYNCLPLLAYLPPENVEYMKVEPLDGYTMFPVEEHLTDLEQLKWPSPTEQVYGFKLVVRLKQTHKLRKHLLPHTDVVFEFIDYPGEWLTDLPMLQVGYQQWSDSTWAQQASEPQLSFAAGWHDYVKQFDFEQPPTTCAIQELVSAYRGYLSAAKQAGISMLQPGSFLLADSGFDWRNHGFTPLPVKVSGDPTNPWGVLFSQRYEHFQTAWLTPLKQSTFKETDKQIILVDLFAGLNHSKQHLLQLKETITHLADTFVYGNPNWFERKIKGKQAIGKVAFVGTKMDLLPRGQQANMQSLLEQVCAGAVAKLQDKPISFEHFLLCAIQATDAGSSEDALRYTNTSGQYVEASFEAIPAKIEDMEKGEHFPMLMAKVPEDFLPRMLSGQGVDRLFQFLLGQSA